MVDVVAIVVLFLLGVVVDDVNAKVVVVYVVAIVVGSVDVSVDCSVVDVVEVFSVDVFSLKGVNDVCSEAVEVYVVADVDSVVALVVVLVVVGDSVQFALPVLQPSQVLIGSTKCDKSKHSRPSVR